VDDADFTTHIVTGTIPSAFANRVEQRRPCGAHESAHKLYERYRVIDGRSKHGKLERVEEKRRV